MQQAWTSQIDRTLPIHGTEIGIEFKDSRAVSLAFPTSNKEALFCLLKVGHTPNEDLMSGNKANDTVQPAIVDLSDQREFSSRGSRASAGGIQALKEFLRPCRRTAAWLMWSSCTCLRARKPACRNSASHQPRSVTQVRERVASFPITSM